MCYSATDIMRCCDLGYSGDLVVELKTMSLPAPRGGTKLGDKFCGLCHEFVYFRKVPGRAVTSKEWLAFLRTKEELEPMFQDIALGPINHKVQEAARNQRSLQGFFELKPVVEGRSANTTEGEVVVNSAVTEVEESIECKFDGDSAVSTEIVGQADKHLFKGNGAESTGTPRDPDCRSLCERVEEELESIQGRVMDIKAMLGEALMGDNTEIHSAKTEAERARLALHQTTEERELLEKEGAKVEGTKHGLRIGSHLGEVIYPQLIQYRMELNTAERKVSKLKKQTEDNEVLVLTWFDLCEAVKRCSDKLKELKTSIDNAELED